MAELTLDEKNAISHRRRALDDLANQLQRTLNARRDPIARFS